MALLFAPHSFRKLAMVTSRDTDGTELQPDYVDAAVDIPCHFTKPGLKIAEDDYGLSDPNARRVKIDLEDFTTLQLHLKDKIAVTTEEFAGKEFSVETEPFPRTEFDELSYAEFAVLPV